MSSTSLAEQITRLLSEVNTDTGDFGASGVHRALSDLSDTTKKARRENTTDRLKLT